jgi:hypothetical protein
MGDGQEIKDRRPVELGKKLTAELTENNSRNHSDSLKAFGDESLNRNLKVEASEDVKTEQHKHFRQAVQSGIDSIPASVQHYLARGQWTFQMYEKISKDDPALAAQVASGHAEGNGTFGDAFGAADFINHRIVVAEKADPLNPNSHTYEADRVNSHPEQILRHETGHALDAALHDYSHSSAFAEAYKDGLEKLKKLPAEEQKELAYYLQKGFGGRQELFAELFAYKHGGGPNKDTIDGKLATIFDKCFGMIEKLEEQIKRENP